MTAKTCKYCKQAVEEGDVCTICKEIGKAMCKKRKKRVVIPRKEYPEYLRKKRGKKNERTENENDNIQSK